MIRIYYHIQPNRARKSAPVRGKNVAALRCFCADRIGAASFESSICNAKQKTTHSGGTVSRKRSVARRRRCEGVYNRAVEASVTFCGKELQRNKANR